MKLYFAKGACSLACRIVINEIGLNCDYIAVDLKAKKTEHNEDYKKINPKGSVPALETEDGKILTENAVIQQYLADESGAHNLLPGIGEFDRYRVLEWLNYVATELHKGFSVLFSPAYTQEMKDEIVIPMMEQKLSFVNQCLEGKKFLLGNNFTLPDSYLFVMLTWATNFKFKLSNWPNVERYFFELAKRSSVVRSLQEEGLI